MSLQNRCLFFLVFPLLVSCSLFNNNSGGGEARYFEFTHQDDQIDYVFTAKTSDAEVIEKIENELAIPFDERTLHINGDIERGTADYNSNWSWHFKPGNWDIVEISVEVCDGRPQMVEEDLDYWIDQVGYFCPWSSRVSKEIDFQE